MSTISLTEWIAITARSQMPLYAVLSNVSDAQAIKNYYLHDGSQTPYGLYSQTPYENWFSVMPMLVKLDENSPFLKWIAETEHKDWGWLARSHLPFESICCHLRSLTQVIMPVNEETVFFRYWDGSYLSMMLDYFVDSWQEILPAFAFYWINNQHYVVDIPVEQEAQQPPWWRIPQELINTIMKDNPTTIITNLLLWLKETYPSYYETLPEILIKQRILALWQSQSAKYNVIDNLIINNLKTKLVEELELVTNPFEELESEFFS